MSQLRFRPATKADIATLHGLVESAYRGTSAKAGWTHEADLLDGQRTDAEELTDIVADPRRQILLGLDGDDLAGCVCVESKDGGRAYLGMLTVDPQRQAGGLGRQLIAAAENLARSQFGAEVMEMTVIAQRAELIAYYERRGYALTSEARPFPLHDPRFGEAKRDDLYFVVMEKALV
ncbi:GNAT family N-acetyltransferase [Brevundimonas pishanensis]|uniref:GNAT family N-acetyltransferase n=1 Tax=Brevundimonas pishanensis TaxID=2896315 RepID=UPI001FA6FE47|nr:GNAT family N-acetyltransferase [Brevundimonas pishanensis]